jgi:histone deacetylase complex regulatory component SIN3
MEIYESKAFESTNLDEAEVKSDEDFIEMTTTIYKKAFGDKYDEEKAKEAAEGMLKKADGDYGAAIGMLQSSVG